MCHVRNRMPFSKAVVDGKCKGLHVKIQYGSETLASLEVFRFFFGGGVLFVDFVVVMSIII